MKKVLIAVDGSPHARHAIDALARLTGAGTLPEVVLVNVRAWPLLLGDVAAASLEQIEASERLRQEQLLDEAAAQARAAGLVVSAKVTAVGEAAGEIVRVAQEHQVDQIALGTRGMGAVRSFVIGSVAQRVVHLSQVPVLLVK